MRNKPRRSPGMIECGLTIPLCFLDRFFSAATRAGAGLMVIGRNPAARGPVRAPPDGGSSHASPRHQFGRHVPSLGAAVCITIIPASAAVS
ncbi:hypothetical protein J6590_008479 [Homalodisca vitripennis]|nr:hypothetical protein J6590_008479 [Homalodisca vitripennis]